MVTKKKAKKRSRVKVKAVRILKIHTLAPEEHVITSETHIQAPISELPDAAAGLSPADMPLEFSPPVEFDPAEKKHSWAAWWKSLWD